MKNLFLFLFLLNSYAIYAQESGKILYSEDICNAPFENETQNLSFKLENGSLFITGRIIANCCGIHFLEYEVYEDSIFLSRIDDGEPCDCYCLYDIDIEIKNCLSNCYKVKLANYNSNTGFDTEVRLNQSSLNDFTTENVKYYPNPAEKQMIIELPNHKFDKFIVYDAFGKILKKIDGIDDNKLFISTENLVSGIYIFRLLKINGATFSKKIIIL